MRLQCESNASTFSTYTECRKMELTKGQNAIWQMEQFAGGSIANICGHMLFKSPNNYSTEEMVSAAIALYSINEALRIKLVMEQQRCMQIITEDTPPVEICSFPTAEAYEDYAKSWAKEPLPFGDSLCLMKVISYPDACGLLVKMHHIISDAWSFTVLGTQFSLLLNGKKPEQVTPYSEVINNEAAYWQGKRAARDLQYYEELHTQQEDILLLANVQSADYNASRISYTLSVALTKAIHEYTEENHYSILAFFLLTYSLYFSRTNMNANHMYIGTTVLNRTKMTEKNMVGMMINTLPVPISLQQDLSFAENMNTAQDSVFSTMRHAKCTYSAIIERLRNRQPTLTQLYDVTVNYQNAEIHDENDQFMTTWFSNGMQTDTLQIHIEDHDRSGVLNVHYDFRNQQMTAADIARLHNAVLHIIENILTASEMPIKQMPIMSDEELHKLTSQITPAPALPHASLSAWLWDCAARWSEQICVETAERTLTYRQLIERATTLYAHFPKMNIFPGDTIGLCVHRKWYLPVAFAACCLYGITFVPIDPDYPENRIHFMLEDSGAVLNLDDALVIKLLNQHSETVTTTLPEGNDGNVYCIYTSGSTGRPKGVIISQSNLLNNVAWRTAYYTLPNVNVINVSNITADTFWEDLTYSLFSGNRFCMVENYRDLVQIHDMVVQHDHVMMMTTPTYFSTIIQNVSLSRFEQVILVGESIDCALAEKILLAGVKLYNEYGPSECTICATCTPITTTDIHIGRPIAGVGVYVLDSNMQPVPIDVPGELCISGRGVGRGYLNRSELSAERFVNDPFNGGSMYRTGDIVKWRSDMNLCFIGRNDNQCKIRGLRVELDEIEKQLLTIEGITKAAVVIRKDHAGQQIICAFYTGRAHDVTALRQQLSLTLPQHMVPHAFQHLLEMPLTTNGKINKLGLPDIELTNTHVQYMQPQNEVERILCEIAEQVLGVSSFGISHNFFEHGGDSLKAIIFVTLAHQRGISIDVQSLFNHPTMHMLAASILQVTSSTTEKSAKKWENVTKQLQNLSWHENDAYTRRGPVLLTGATGYLGAHILYELWAKTEDDIYCIVRGKTNRESTERLSEVLSLYFGNHLPDSFNQRVHVLNGDLTEHALGLSEHQYQDLCATISCVVHAAANVKHYGHYEEFYRDNVLATSKVIEFSRSSKAYLVHVSTTSVSGLDLNQHQTAPAFTEHDLYFGQNLSNVYVRSKFQAETLVLEAIHDDLSGCIARIGNLTCRYRDGVFQRNSTASAFAKRMSAMIELGVYPDTISDLHIEFTPVDEAASAIVLLAIHANKRPVFHVMNPHLVTLRCVAQSFSAHGAKLVPLSEESFYQIFHADNAKAQIAREAFVNETTANGSLQLSGSVQIKCQETVNWLDIHGFHWHPVDDNYLAQYLHSLKEMRKAR